MQRVSILWFRNGLRIHDNGSLIKATEEGQGALLPIFIYDGETPVTKHCGYNKISFLIECLEDLDRQFREFGSQLYFLKGNPTEVFRKLSKNLKITSICFDQDCESIWLERDNAVKNFCSSHKISCHEHVGATLWDPLEVIDANGGTPPLTYSQFCHVTLGVGPPPRPCPSVDLATVTFASLAEDLLAEMHFYTSIPTAEMLGFNRTIEKKVYRGGETAALKYFKQRVIYEKEAFLDGSFLPNRRDPDILNPPKSLSPDFKFGCLSVRLFYWSIMDAFEQVYENNPKPSYAIVNQLIWREFFYVMSANNPFYGEIERNPICINIPWYKDPEALEKFLEGNTGFPFIDAGVRQLKIEGWIHHILRNALSMFLTRGDLWLSWEHGLNMFLRYLIDGDWAICAGNWMWVSSSAFEKSLNCSYSLDPRIYGRRIDPSGEYVRKYVPELKNFPSEYIYEPWTAPRSVQEKADCIIGENYPAPMIDHDVAVAQNAKMMVSLEEALLKKSAKLGPPQHVMPSSKSEVRSFFRLNISED